jgi:transcriptional regulator with XRE-family HTH domain
MKALGERLRTVRERLKAKDSKYSLRKVAERIGVSPGYLSLVENGLETPTDDRLQLLAKELGDSLDVLMILKGRLTDDLRDIVSRRPDLFRDLLVQMRDAPDDAILRVIREVRDGDW